MFAKELSFIDLIVKGARMSTKPRNVSQNIEITFYGIIRFRPENFGRNAVVTAIRRSCDLITINQAGVTHGSKNKTNS